MLSFAEDRLLGELMPAAVRTIGRPRIDAVLSIVVKLRQQLAQAEFMANSFWLAASGVISEDDIARQPRLSAEQRGDVLAVLQTRYDATAYRQICGHELPPLPEAVGYQPVSADPFPILTADEAIHAAPRVG